MYYWLQAARNIIMQGAEKNPDSEEIWLEAIKLMPPNNQKSVAAQVWQTLLALLSLSSK